MRGIPAILVCTGAGSGVWVKEDSLQALGPEEQNQTADSFLLLSSLYYN